MFTPTTPTPAPTLSLSTSDRRRHKRFPVARPGKLFRRSTQQYAPVRTLNLSFSGALLEIQSERPIVVGELIDLGVAFRDRTVVESKSLVQGIVARVETLAADRQRVAVRYIQPSALLAAA